MPHNKGGSVCGSHCRMRRMRSHFVVLLAWIFFAAGPSVWAEAPIYKTEPSATFLRDWLLCGPIPLEPVGNAYPDTKHIPGFDIDFLGGEVDAAPKEGDAVSWDGASVAWLRHGSGGDNVNLDEALSTDEGVFAYAYCEIEMGGPKACVLSLGHNDGGRVWLNGERVWDRPAGGASRMDDHLVPVLLKEGTNRLLLKIEERGGAWAFACRLLPFDSPELPHDRLLLYRLNTTKAGVSTLTVLPEPARARALLKGIALRAAQVDAPEATVWQGAWSGERELAVAVDRPFYDAYMLHVRTTFADGTEYERQVPFTAGPRVEHKLFAGGATDYRILIAADASESEQWAAKELAHWLGEMSGAAFPIQDAAAPYAGAAIVVGLNARARTLLGDDFETPDMLDQSFAYQSVGRDLVIYGGAQSGTMYGVLTFLERELGVRWYTPEVTVAPKRDAFSFVRVRHGESPGIRVRNDFYYEAFDPIWAARNKVNGELAWGPVRQQPGGVETYWRVHTFNVFVPPAEFFETHPEYFSLIKGKRRAEHAQLCLTNPEVVRILTERTLEHMRKDPNHLIYSVSQNDGYNPCECGPCQAVVEREGSEIGPILEMVNHVAEAAETEFPDKFIGTLAYVYSRKPPKTLRPRKNVVIRLCSFECCRAHPLEACARNASFVEDIKGWSAITPRLYIWDYVVDFGNYVLPFPTFRVLQPNMQFLRDHNAIGVMPQGAYQSRGGEFAELRMYVLAKLLWNPDVDVEEILADFMHGYYGRSGHYVRAYFDLLQGLASEETHIRHWGPRDPMLTEAFVREADALFDKAERVAESDAFRERVEMARLPLLYLKCRRSPAEAVRDGSYGRLKAITEREKVTHFSEAGPPFVVAFHEKMEALTTHDAH